MRNSLFICLICLCLTSCDYLYDGQWLEPYVPNRNDNIYQIDPWNVKEFTEDLPAVAAETAEKIDEELKQFRDYSPILNARGNVLSEPKLEPQTGSNSYGEEVGVKAASLVATDASGTTADSVRSMEFYKGLGSWGARDPIIKSWIANGVKRKAVTMDQSGGGDWQINLGGIAPSAQCMLYSYAMAMTYLTGQIVTVPEVGKAGNQTGKLNNYSSSDRGGFPEFPSIYGVYGTYCGGTPTAAGGHVSVSSSIAAIMKQDLANQTVVVIYRGGNKNGRNPISRNASGSHYVVLVDYDQEKDVIFMLDPWGGSIKQVPGKDLTNTGGISWQVYSKNAGVVSRYN